MWLLLITDPHIPKLKTRQTKNPTNPQKPNLCFIFSTNKVEVAILNIPLCVQILNILFLKKGTMPKNSDKLKGVIVNRKIIVTKPFTTEV